MPPSQLTANISVSPRRAETATSATTLAARHPVSVPGRLMAPSVPGSATRKLVIMRGRLLSTWPNSEETVSAAASQSAAIPIMKTALGRSPKR